MTNVVFCAHDRYGGGMSSAKAALESDTRVSEPFKFTMEYTIKSHLLLCIDLRSSMLLLCILTCTVIIGL
jgi:hypothetical protein